MIIKKRRFITLIEMMVVMFLIALITGVLAYNIQGSLEEGKFSKTKLGIEKIDMILSLRLAENPELADSIESNWTEIIKNDPLVKDAAALVKDGWGQEYKVTIENNVIKVYSNKYADYKKSKTAK